MAPHPPVLRPRPAGERAVDRRMRVLLPHRLDALSGVMDTNTITQWYWLSAACDLVIWSPGVHGYRDVPLDVAARAVDADAVLLPDWHSRAGAIHRELWRGARDSAVPVVWYIDDQAANLALREDILREVRPAGVIFQGDTRHLTHYEALRAELGWQWLITSRGVDRGIFRPGPAGTERDIDILVGGADEPAEVYPVRRMVKGAARSLADRWNVVELPHPGYWELGGVQGRGQAFYAELLQRSRLATTGTAYGKLSVKYGEVAACGAVGVGDLPMGEPAAGALRDAMLVVDPSWDDDRVAAEMDALLQDAGRLGRMSDEGIRAVDGSDHREHAFDYADLLAQLVDARGPRSHPRRPRPFPAPAPTVRVVAAAEPESVPPVRADWASIWDAGRSGASRTRRLEAALAGRAEDVTVVAFDPDAALDLEALMLSEAVRADGRVAIRPVRAPLADEQPLHVPWVIVAAPTAALRDALVAERGRSGVERAILALADRLGANVLDAGGYGDLAPELMLLDALLHSRRGMPVGTLRRRLESLITRAGFLGRGHTAAEAAGWAACALGGAGGFEHAELAAGVTPQDPELEVPPPAGDGFAVLDPSRADVVEAIAAHVARGRDAEPLSLGVPMEAGLLPDEAAGALLVRLSESGVDVDAGPDLTVLERPLWAGEVLWLAERHPAPPAVTASHAVA